MLPKCHTLKMLREMERLIQFTEGWPAGILAADLEAALNAEKYSIRGNYDEGM